MERRLERMKPEIQNQVRTYAQLRRKVEETLEQGRARARGAVEKEKVRTFWEIGRWIDAHILYHKDRAGYGERVLVRLARHVNLSKTQLYYGLEFARAYPIFLPVGKLTWTDYQDLLSVNDEAKRRALAQEAEKFGWSRPQLRARIREIKGGGKSRKPSPGRPVPNRLIPKRGLLHTYRILQSESIHGEPPELLLDLGFYIDFPLALVTRRKFKEGDIVEDKVHSPATRRHRLVKLPQATKRDLFTYRASVLRVVDADTLWLRVQLGFGPKPRRKLRLRGIDAPELGTRAGKRAKAFVENELKDVPFVTITTTKPDKFDRYLTDLYYEKDGKDIFLNQLLLDKGLARPASDEE